MGGIAGGVEMANNKKEFTVADFIQRLEKLPKDLQINGYVFQTDDGEVRNTWEMGEIIKPVEEDI